MGSHRTESDEAVALALEFARLLHEQINPEDMEACVNFAKANPTSAVCLTHDYCDSNQVILDAFRNVMGRGMDILHADDSSLVGFAWDLARRLGFSANPYASDVAFKDWVISGISVSDLGSPALVCGQHVSECGLNGYVGIAYGDGSFMVKDGVDAYTVLLGNESYNGSAQSMELILWALHARNNQ